MSLGASLLRRRDEGARLLVPYVTGGMQSDWLDVVRAIASAGADAIEIGLPFSDPVMDGPVIEAASVRALALGASATKIVEALGSLDLDIPLIVMTYYNVVARASEPAMAALLAENGVAGVIVPDLPFDEAGSWMAATSSVGVDNILMAAPSTPDERLARIGAATSGFLYAIATMGVTGERGSLGADAARTASRASAVTKLPILLGIGVSTPEQARAAALAADGVIVGSALVRRLLDGGGPVSAAALVRELRAGLDGCD
jgi:tryptophan synthase alpha chain